MEEGLSGDYRSRSLPTEEAHEEAAERCSRFFKVPRVEREKFFTLAGLYFTIVLAYSILRDAKDAVVIGRMLPSSIQYLKSFIVVAATIGFAILFQFLLARGATLEKIMFGMTTAFGVFYFVFSVLILPNTETLEPYKFWIADIFADKKMSVRGLEYLNGLFLTINFWTGTLLYISAELWGNVMTSLMFFSIANDICPLRQALRFYPLFQIGANLALMCSGGIMTTSSFALESHPAIQLHIFGSLIFFVSILCAVNIFLYRHLVKNIIPYPIYIVSENAGQRRKKEKVSMLEGFKIMMKNPLVLHMSITVLAYGICTNLVESVYKSGMRIKSATEMKDTMTMVMRIQGNQQIMIGGLVIVTLLSPLKLLIQKRGWLSLGIITPTAMLCGTVLFLALVWANVSISSGVDSNILSRIGKPIFTTILPLEESIWFEVYLGMAVVNMVKVLKYAAFDIGKEAIGVKIPKDYRARFKGVYDGVCGKLGKSFASTSQLILFSLFNTSDIREVSPLLLAFSVIVILTWTGSVMYLGLKYDEAVREDRDIHVVETADKAAKLEEDFEGENKVADAK
jgi:ATP:ADP antiporter, AAA family